MYDPPYQVVQAPKNDNWFLKIIAILIFIGLIYFGVISFINFIFGDNGLQLSQYTPYFVFGFFCIFGGLAVVSKVIEFFDFK